MESINRVLSTCAVGESSKEVILLLFNLIVENLNYTLGKIGVENPETEEVKIITEFSDEDKNDTELMAKIDLQWLFYEYRGLLKTYLRKFNLQHSDYSKEIEDIFESIRML